MPNILLILTDDQRAHPDGAGNDLLDVMPNLHTNVLDRATHFPNYHTSSPICAPSRATMYSGLYASQHGVWTVASTDADNWNEYFSFVRLLQADGWRTGIIGKFNNFFPADQARWFDFAYPITSLSDPDEIIDLLAQATIFITDPDPRPWFLSWCPHVPHDPYDHTPITPITPPTFTAAPSAFEADVSEKVAPGSVSGTTRANAEDDFDGQIQELARLDEIIDDLFALFTGPELDATAVFFASDNGYLFAEHGYLEKEMPYRESTNVPFYLAWPNGGVDEDATDARLCSNIDIAPTILDIANVDADYEMPGRSLLLPASGHPDWLYIESPEGATTGVGAWRGIREADRLYVEWTDAGEYESYATDTDPTEQAGSNAIDSAMQARLDALPWQASGAMSTITSEPQDEAGTRIIVLDPAPSSDVGDADAWLTLANASGLTDLTGNGHHGYGMEGLEVGDSAEAPPGMAGSTSFDGSTHEIELTGYQPLTATGTVTLAAWVLRGASATGIYQPIFSFQTYSLRFDDLTANQIAIRELNSVDPITMPSSLVGAWHLIALEINRSTDAGRVFIDGVQLATVASLGHVALTDSDLRIGSMPVDDDRFVGNMSRFSVHERALTAAEHLAMYTEAATAGASNELVLAPTTNGITLLDGFSFPVTADEPTYLEAPRMEGRRRISTRPTNPTGAGRVLIEGDTAEEYYDRASTFQGKVAQVNRHGGVMAYTRGDGVTVYYDIVAMGLSEETGTEAFNPSNRVGIMGFAFECRPYGRLDPVSLLSDESLTGPIEGVELPTVNGHVDALAELTITDASSASADFVEFGIGQQGYDPDSALLVDDVDMVTAGYAGTQTGTDPVVTALTDTTVTCCSMGFLTSGGRQKVAVLVNSDEDDVWIRLVWRLDEGAPSYGRWVELSAATVMEPTLAVIDVGDASRWEGRFEAFAGDGSATLSIHGAYILPAEVCGRLRAVSGDTALFAGQAARFTSQGAYREDFNGDQFARYPLDGDTLRIPASTAMDLPSLLVIRRRLNDIDAGEASDGRTANVTATLEITPRVSLY